MLTWVTPSRAWGLKLSQDALLDHVSLKVQCSVLVMWPLTLGCSGTSRAPPSSAQAARMTWDLPHLSSQSSFKQLFAHDCGTLDLIEMMSEKYSDFDKTCLLKFTVLGLEWSMTGCGSIPHARSNF